MKISDEIRASWLKMKPLPNPNAEAHHRFMNRVNKEITDVKIKEVSFAIDEEFISELQERTGAASLIEVLSEALALLDWASKEREKGRFVLSSNEQGGEIHRIVTSSLESESSSS